MPSITIKYEFPNDMRLNNHTLGTDDFIGDLIGEAAHVAHAKVDSNENQNGVRTMTLRFNSKEAFLIFQLRIDERINAWKKMN